MAKYAVTYGCGHEATVRLVGPGKDRERKLAWMRTIGCPRCQRDASEAEGIKAHVYLEARRSEDDRPKYVIALVDARPQREALRDLGYRFDPEWMDEGEGHFFMRWVGSAKPPKTCWKKEFKVDTDAHWATAWAATKAEIEALVSSGLVKSDLIKRRSRADMATEFSWDMALAVEYDRRKALRVETERARRQAEIAALYSISEGTRTMPDGKKLPTWRVVFPFDPATNAAIKRFRSAKWVAKDRLWSILQRDAWRDDIETILADARMRTAR